MNLVLLFAVLAFLAALVAAWAAPRPRPADPAPMEALRQEVARQRRDIQGDTSTALAPLLQALLDLGQDLAKAKAELGMAQSEALAARFTELSTAIQEALRAARVA